MKKILSVLLCTIILITSIWFCINHPVQASSPVTITNFLKAALLEKGKSVTGDTIFDFFDWMYDLYEDSNQEIIDFMSKDNLNQFLSLLPDMLGLEGEVITQNDNDTYIVTKDFLDAMDSLFEQYLLETPETVNVVWIPVISSDKVSANFFNTVSGYYKFRSWTDNETLSYVSGNLITVNEAESDFHENIGGTTKYFKSVVTVQHGLDNLAFIHANFYTKWSSLVPVSAYWTNAWGNPLPTYSISRINLYRADGIMTNREDFTYHAMSLSENDVYPISSPSNVYFGVQAEWIYPFNPTVLIPGGTGGVPGGFLVRGCNTDAPSFIPVFQNLNAYKSWITGQGNYYRFHSGYTGGDITINPNVDYDQITTAIQNAMRQSTENGDSFETMLSQMQAAFSNALAEISGTLNEIGGNTAESNSWLKKIYEKLSDLYDQLVPADPEET